MLLIIKSVPCPGGERGMQRSSLWRGVLLGNQSSCIGARPDASSHISHPHTLDRGVIQNPFSNQYKRSLSLMNEEKLNQLLGKFVNDFGATLHAGMVVIGEKLGL